MNYKESLQAIDPLKAFKALNISADQQGSYIYYPCTSCGRQAVIKACGDKKNVWYCPECKDKGHIISLVLSVMSETDSEPWDYEKAKRFLVQKAVVYSPNTIKKELSFNYELEYDPFLEEQGISKELCEKLGIGRPKGKTMLSGCIAFTVSDGTGRKIAYYGVRIKGHKTVFHKSFNPELYLYNFNSVIKFLCPLFSASLNIALQCYQKVAVIKGYLYVTI
jgi:hypothetical protein